MKCKYCGKEIYPDEGYEDIGRCKNDCFNKNVAVKIKK